MRDIFKPKKRPARVWAGIRFAGLLFGLWGNFLRFERESSHRSACPYFALLSIRNPQ